MSRDADRVRLNSAVLEAHSWDGVVCASPENVLLATGYWPVIGNALAVMTRDGAAVAIAPEDENKFAASSRAEKVYTFEAASLSWIRPIEDVVCEPLRDALHALGLDRTGCKVGYAVGPVVDGAGYAARFTWGAIVAHLLRRLLGNGELSDCTDALLDLRSVLTSSEIDSLKTGCRIAERAFHETAEKLHPGLTESEVAEDFRKHLGGTRESGGFAYCMSGPNSATAYRAYQESTNRRLKQDDVVLVHCNSCYLGLWTDITRTFLTGDPEQKFDHIRTAVAEARHAAIAAVHPGATACSVDAAARTVMTKHGFGDAFRHATGHGVGYSAINHNAKPRIHPLSDEILSPGMVFNIEPAAYIDGVAGFRHCDMAAVTESGCDVLSDFLQI